MKTIILFTFSILILISCNQKENNQPKKAIISGQVSNFEKVSEHDFIVFIYKDILTGQVELVENLDENGRFKFVLDLDFPTEFYLKYSALLTYHVSPGDSLHFNINADCWSRTSETFAEEYNFYKVSGTSEKMNNDVAKYTAFFVDSLSNWSILDSMIKNSSPIEYKVFLEELTEERLEIVENFNKANNTCKEFQEWVNMKLEFEKWDDLMKYGRLHSKHKKTDPDEFITSIPEDYFDFLNEWDKENKKYLESKNYLTFLQEYGVYILPIDTLKVYLALYKTDFEESMGFFVRYYSTVETGFIKDLLVSKHYHQVIDDNYEKIKNIYNPELIKDKYLNSRIQKKFETEKNLFENPQYAAGSKINELAAENDYLKNLKERYPNKVLYIDFWAPWCGPCMGEIPHAKKIKKQFEDKDVVFIYLANRCEEAAWKSTIAEKKIEGEHYHLTDKQYAELSQIFGIVGIPHYTLIDKSGKIVRDKAPRPSSGEDLINLMEKLLE